LIQLLVRIEKSDDQVIGDQQRSCAEYSASDPIVVADDGVLHGIG